MGEHMFGFLARWFRRWLGIEDLDHHMEDRIESAANLWGPVHKLKDDAVRLAEEIRAVSRHEGLTSRSLADHVAQYAYDTKQWDEWRTRAIGNNIFQELEKDLQACMDKQLQLEENVADLAKEAGVELSIVPLKAEICPECPHLATEHEGIYGESEPDKHEILIGVKCPAKNCPCKIMRKEEATS